MNPLKLINPKLKMDGRLALGSKFIEFLKSYKWSSYLDYLGIIRPENKIFEKIDFIDYFESKKSFQKEIFEWIKIKVEEEN